MGYRDFYKLADKEKLETLEATANLVGVPPFAAEKDWWVVRTLDIIFGMDVAPHLVFKGGTSLSKSWGLIERFSEDIDLALDKTFLGFDGSDFGRQKLTRLRKASLDFISNKFLPNLKDKFGEAGFEEVDIRLGAVKRSDQDPVMVELYYPHITKQSDYVQPRVLVEIGSRSLKEPFTNRDIQSFVGAKFSTRPFADDPITIPSVNPERTYLEKLFLLHEEFQKPKEKIRVDRLSRHLYDIDRISNSEYAKLALEDQDLLRSIVEHRKTFTKIGGVDYNSHYPPNLSPIPPEELLKDWERDYQLMTDQMIYGNSLTFKELIESIAKISADINRLKLS